MLIRGVAGLSGRDGKMPHPLSSEVPHYADNQSVVRAHRPRRNSRRGGTLDHLSHNARSGGAARCREPGAGCAAAHVRHSSAHHVAVEVLSTSSEVEISVTDDGTGFDPTALRHGMGLENLRTRVANRSGDLDISTSPSGTTVSVRLPG